MDLQNIVDEFRKLGVMPVASVFYNKMMAAHPRENHVTSTVGTTATQVSHHQPNRTYFQAVNLSANLGYLGISDEVSATRGWPVAANGGMVQFRIQEDMELATLSFWAINNTASGTWWFLELLGDIQPAG